MVLIDYIIPLSEGRKSYSDQTLHLVTFICRFPRICVDSFDCNISSWLPFQALNKIQAQYIHYCYVGIYWFWSRQSSCPLNPSSNPEDSAQCCVRFTSLVKSTVLGTCRQLSYLFVTKSSTLLSRCSSSESESDNEAALYSVSWPVSFMSTTALLCQWISKTCALKS